MFPKTKSGESAHRERKRHLEIGIIAEEISSVLKNSPDFDNKNISILEFGSGDGFQIPYLKRLGTVVASDIYASDGIRSLQDVEFVQCEIAHTPFDNGQFDIIFSNHVIEHIDDITCALHETQRIGTSSCIYAFSVPTNIWLLLSIPAQYYKKLENMISRMRQLSSGTSNNTSKVNMNKNSSFSDRSPETPSKFAKYVRLIMPRGHGVTLNFVDCYRNFKIRRWKQLLSDNGFSIIRIRPLLLYGPSEWPVIPTLDSDISICSSVLFLMKKNL